MDDEKYLPAFQLIEHAGDAESDFMLCMEKAQEELNEREYTTSAGGGMVKVTVNGEMELVNLTIDPDALDPEDVDMLQDMIMAAVNEAVRGVNELANKQMGAITGGLNIPGMPF